MLYQKISEGVIEPKLVKLGHGLGVIKSLFLSVVQKLGTLRIIGLSVSLGRWSLGASYELLATMPGVIVIFGVSQYHAPNMLPGMAARLNIAAQVALIFWTKSRKRVNSPFCVICGSSISEV
jgi:hypothetical protein